MSESIKWIDLTDVGFKLMVHAHSTGYLFVLKQTGNVDAKILEALHLGGFKDFARGLAAPLTWGRADLLKSLPGARSIELTRIELARLGYRAAQGDRYAGDSDRHVDASRQIRADASGAPEEAPSGGAHSTQGGRKAGTASQDGPATHGDRSGEADPRAPRSTPVPRSEQLGGADASREHGEANGRGGHTAGAGSNSVGDSQGAVASVAEDEPRQPIVQIKWWLHTVEQLEAAQQGAPLTSRQLETYRRVCDDALAEGRPVPLRVAKSLLDAFPDCAEASTYIEGYTQFLEGLAQRFPAAESLRPREEMNVSLRMAMKGPDGNRTPKVRGASTPVERWRANVEQVHTEYVRQLNADMAQYAAIRIGGHDACDGMYAGQSAESVLSIKQAHIETLLALRAVLDAELAALDEESSKDAGNVSEGTLEVVRPFLSRPEYDALLEGVRGEEKEFFVAKLSEYAQRIQEMPQVYEQDGKGDEAIVYLHYFKGGSDWYILEKDTESGQNQAFGYAVLNGDTDNAELSYISIAELVSYGVELDLYWTPQPLRKVKAIREGSSLNPEMAFNEEAVPTQQQGEEPPAASPAPKSDHFFIGDEIDRGNGGFAPQKRFAENIEALRVLKRLETSGQSASDDERSTMARWAGWGGLADLTVDYPTRNEAAWVADGRIELQKLLSSDEIASARASVNNAHYTPPVVVRAIWDTVQRLGFRGGRVLEPGCGIGNFIGLCPSSLVEKSRFLGVEKEDLTGRMTRLIYPDADIRVQAFEDVRLPNGWFDLVVGNVPFGEVRVYDPEYEKLRLKIHDYFVVKSLDKLKDGGIAALITSSGTMDKLSPQARRTFAARGVFVGALRLPTNAFEAQARASVTTDVLFFYKCPQPALSQLPKEACEWIETKTETFTDANHGYDRVLNVNPYFLNHPESVLGQMTLGSAAGGRPCIDVVLDGGQSLTDELVRGGDAIVQRAQEYRNAGLIETSEGKSQTRKIKVDFSDEKEGEAPPLKSDEILDDELQFGAFFVQQGDDGQRRVYQIAELNGEKVAIDTELKGKRMQRLLGLISVRDAMREAFQLQKELPDSPESERVCGEARVRLNQAYDAFVQAHGPINLPVNRRLFRDDPDFGRVCALEVYDATKKTAGKSDIFFKRVLTPARRLRAETAQEALAVSLDQQGTIDWSYMSHVSGRPALVLRDELLRSRQVFVDPENERYVTAVEYLSGDVRAKLDYAKTAAELDAVYAPNVDALEAVQPSDLTPKEIEVRLGAPWVDPDDMCDFVCSVLKLDATQRKEVHFRRSTYTGEWTMSFPFSGRRGVYATVEYGTDRMPFQYILERVMNNRPVIVNDTEPDGRTVKNVKETMLAEEKHALIEQEFRKWIWADQERADRLVEQYNRLYNCYVPPLYDGSHLTFPGMSESFKPRPSQASAVWRSIMDDRALFAHEVGTGKTFEQVASAIERKRLGKSVKPLLAVPNHMLEQIEREARQIYPEARILAITKDDLRGDRRKLFMGQVANNDWDLVICTHSVLSKINLPPDFERRVSERELENLRAELQGMKDEEKAGAPRFSVKRIENRVESLAQKLREMSDVRKDSGVYIDDMGIDSITIDESHNFKNLSVDAGRDLGGISGSKRAWNLYMLIQWLAEKRGKPSGVFFATGTAITNNVWEIYNLYRYLQPDVLGQMGLSTPAAWASTFLQPKTSWEPSASGTGWKLKTRYVLQNVPELIRTLRLTMDVVTAEDAGVVRPEMERRNMVSPMSPAQRAYMRHLDKRVRGLSGVDPRKDNLLKIVSEGRKVALDPKLVLPSAPDYPESKVNACANNIAEEWREHVSIKGTQLVFCDQGVPHSHDKSVYGRLRQKLVDRGVPAEEIAFIHDYNTDEKKAGLFKSVRNGLVRVLIGSSGKMGEGTNVQNRATAVHHLDPPWRPDQIEQRNGRVKRFGNLNKDVRCYIYTTEGSFDLFMWSTMQRKAELFTRVLKGDPNVRSFDFEVDPTFAETAAVTSSNTLLKEKLDVDQQIERLQVLQKGFQNEQWVSRHMIKNVTEDIETVRATLEKIDTLPKPISDPTVWTFDMQKYGYLAPFEGNREEMLRMVRKVMETQQVSAVEGLTCGGVSVTLCRAEDPVEKKTISIWTLNGDVTRSRAVDVERVFLDQTGEKEKLIAQLEHFQGELDRHKAVLTNVWPHDEELTELLVRRQSILHAIEEESKKSVDDDELLDAEMEDILARYSVVERQGVENDEEDEFAQLGAEMAMSCCAACN